VSPIPPPFTSPERFSCAGKTFLLGEYAVLAGAPAWVATVGPRFELQTGTGTSLKKLFHPESPAGKFITNSALGGLTGEFHDPWAGQGGLGASTAQFILIFRAALGPNRSWKEVFNAYRKVTEHESLPPSGADLVAQWAGGIVRFTPSSLLLEQLHGSGKLDWNRFLFFSATGQPSRKVPTHLHLAKLQSFPVTHSQLINELRTVLKEAEIAFEAGDHPVFGSLLTRYGDLLAESELEIPATAEDRAVLGPLPGVIGIKGTGALQADGILLMIDPAKADRARIIAEARARNLVLISDGLQNHEGLK